MLNALQILCRSYIYNVVLLTYKTVRKAKENVKRKSKKDGYRDS